MRTRLRTRRAIRLLQGDDAAGGAQVIQQMADWIGKDQIIKGHQYVARVSERELSRSILQSRNVRLARHRCHIDFHVGRQEPAQAL